MSFGHAITELNNRTRNKTCSPHILLLSYYIACFKCDYLIEIGRVSANMGATHLGVESPLFNCEISYEPKSPYLTPATGKKLGDVVEGSDKSAKYKRSTRFKTELTTSNLVLKMPFYAIESYALYWDALINKTNYVTFKDMSNPTVQDRFRGLIQTEKNILGLISINTSATSETSSSHVARYCIAVFDAATGEYLKALPLYGKYESGNQYYKVWYAAECEKEAGSAIALTYAKSQYCIIDLDNLTSYLGCIIEDTHYVTRGATAAILKTKIVALPQSSGSSPILNHIDKTKATANFESAAVTGDLSAQVSWTSKTISVASQSSRRGILKVSGDIVWVYVAWYNSSTTRHSKLYVQKYDFSSNPTEPEESTVLSLDFSSKHSDVTCTYLCHDDIYAYFYVQPFISFGSSYSTSTRKYNKKVLRVNMTSWDSNFSDISFEDTTDTKVDLSYLNRIFYINATASYLGYIDHDHYFCTASYAYSSHSTSDMLFAFNDQTLEIETIPYLSPARMINGTSFGSSNYDRSGKFKAYPGEIIPGTGFLYYYPYVIDVRSRKAYKPTFSISTKWNRSNNYVALTTNDRQVEVGAKNDNDGGKENALYVGYFGNVKNKVGLPYASRVAVTTNGGLCNSDLYLEAFDITEEVVAEPVED